MIKKRLLFLFVLILLGEHTVKSGLASQVAPENKADAVKKESIEIDVKIDVCGADTCHVYEYNTNIKVKEKTVNSEARQEMEQKKDTMTEQKTYVRVYTLKNGLTVLVRVVHTVPKVSIQLWYNVGSKDEHDGVRGVAHLIEHMIFKGTKKLSESDINTIAHMLSGSINAFTSYDYTGYLFNLPSQNWKQVFPVMADCMENCAFKEDMLSSEMKAVIQELKMNRDSYMRTLFYEQIGAIFADHPYHHPVIGYKQDLWSVKGSDLAGFYKKHYKPNNATLVVVGDVDPDEVFRQAEKDFGGIEADPLYKKEEFYHGQDIAAKSIEIYRDVQQPRVTFTFVVPGASAKKDHIVSLVELMLGHGNSSRLYKKIVEELQLATSLACMSEGLFDHGLFFIVVEPKSVESIDAIQAAIKQELRELAVNGITDEELTQAIKQAKMDFYSLLEDYESQAYEIGKYYLATGDPDYVFNYLNYPFAELKKDANELIAQCLRPTIMHKGVVLPLPETEKAEWAKLQKISDKEDERILAGRIRTSEIEPPVYAETVKIGERVSFDFPKAQEVMLSNGIKILYDNDNNTPKIDLIMSFAARSYYDSEKLPGLYSFVANMMTEGTKNYTAQGLAHAIESRGMSISVNPGKIAISLLSEDLPFALDILNEIVVNATFPEKEIEKVRDQMHAQLKRFWDSPNSFGGLLVKQELYKGHPYSKNLLGTKESIDAITQKDLVDFYHTYMTPQGARIALVGDLQKYDIIKLLEEKLGTFKGAAIMPVVFPEVKYTKAHEINYPISRDQVVLYIGGLSIDRKHPDFDKLMLFDQIYGGGVLGSMSSRLFDLREQSGLFYTISGSLIAGADEQPGMAMVSTIVSLDRLAESEKAIKNTMETVVDTITPQEFAEAKNAVINSLVNNFTSTGRIAEAFLFLDRYHFPADFFDTRAQQLEKITLEQVKEAAHKILDKKELLTLRIGRVDGLKQEQEAKPATAA